MGIYVDIDLDFLVSPVRSTSTNNIRLYKWEECSVQNTDDFIMQLREKGLLIAGERKFFTNHKKSYTYWWIRKMTGMTLVHIDAHSDLYRNRRRDLMLLNDMDMGCDDYIWYAIRDGFISKLFWVVPEGLYDLTDAELAKRFISSEMLREYKTEDGMLHIKFSVITRLGEMDIDYVICTLNKLPTIEGCELMTVATSPEFIPKSADEGVFRSLEMLGAAEEEIERISKLHGEMSEG